MIKMMAVAAMTTFLFACGGGGGGGGGGVSGTVVNGVAQAGIFSSGQAVFKGYSGATRDKEFILNTITFAAADKSKFTANIGSYSGLLKVEVSGAYADEATQKPVTVLATAPLKAALPSTSVTNGMTIIVTPLTDLAVNKAAEGGAKLTDTSVSDNNKAVSILFGIEDIVKTVPTAPDAASLAASNDNKQKTYTAALLIVSQYVAEYAKTSKNNNSTTNITSNDLAAALPAALAQLSSGINVNTSAATPVVTITSPVVAFRLNQALANIATNTATATLVAAAGINATNVITTVINSAIASSDSSVKDVKLLTLRASGSLSGKIGAIQFGLTIPDGATIKADLDRLTLPGVVESAGSGFGSQLFGMMSFDGKTLTVGIINASGFGTGTFSVIYCSAPTTVSTTDFNLINGSIKIKDTNGANITGLTITVE